MAAKVTSVWRLRIGSCHVTVQFCCDFSCLGTAGRSPEYFGCPSPVPTHDSRDGNTGKEDVSVPGGGSAVSTLKPRGAQATSCGMSPGHGQGRGSGFQPLLCCRGMFWGRSCCTGTSGDAGRAAWWCEGMHGTVMQTPLFSSPQLSGGDPECSCDEGDETSRKKRSRSL